MITRVAVLGAGSWGTALAVHLARVGHDVQLWARDPQTVRDIRQRRANVVYLPDVHVPDGVSPTDSLPEALRDTALVVCAIPSHGCRAVMHAAAPHLAPGAILVSATKGLETDTMLRMSEVIAQEAGDQIGINIVRQQLHGKSHACQRGPQIMRDASHQRCSVRQEIADLLCHGVEVVNQ